MILVALTQSWQSHKQLRKLISLDAVTGTQTPGLFLAPVDAGSGGVAGTIAHHTTSLCPLTEHKHKCSMLCMAVLPLGRREGSASSAAVGVHIPQAQAAVLPSCGNMAAVWQGAGGIYLPNMILPQLCRLQTQQFSLKL